MKDKSTFFWLMFNANLPYHVSIYPYPNQSQSTFQPKLWFFTSVH